LPPSSLPLSALLSQALVAFTIEADNEAEVRIPHRTQSYGRAPGASSGSPWLTSMLMWANCLRHLPDEGITIAEMSARARTGTNLDGMRRWRYVTFTPDPGHGKRPRPDALIRPTAWGIAARDTWQEVTAEVESRWRGRLGDDEFAALRAALADVTGHLDPALPDCLPILGYGLYTAPRGGHAGSGSPAGLPASGDAGARPVPVRELPLWALLARPLLAFARQYEAEPGPSLAVSADILRVLTEDGVATRDIPALGGVSRESVAMALGVLRKSGLAVEGPDPRGSRFKVTRLTARGAAARDEYPALTAGIERDWRTRFVAAAGNGAGAASAVTGLRAALERLAADRAGGQPPVLRVGLDPYPENWRARLPPPRTLPHYPMTLHRGGFPDGA
ncbi:MAG TPA: hypothetical protein VHF26_08565, partial [Trebonia sp.]|nr:hypothetical protein [Trebonia sp.]